MQSLYSFLSSKNNQISILEKAMLRHINEVVDLKFVIISLLIEIINYADIFYEEGKKKYFPSANDLAPNRRFVDNKLIFELRQDKALMMKVSKFSFLWINNDHDIPRKLFTAIIKSNLYASYLESKNTSTSFDKRFIIDIMNDFVLNNQLVHHILEEKSIYWVDDLPFVATILFGNIQHNKILLNGSPYKDSSDKHFAINLFRNTINHNSEFENIIVKFAKNWELERIAKMDQLFLKMAFSEILMMPNLPIKVSMNEYIEIAKYYSTSKSKLFINGILDAFVKDYTKKDKINKVGEGLI